MPRIMTLAVTIFIRQTGCVGGLEHIEVTAGIAEEYQVSSGRRHGADDWVAGFQAPLPDTVITDFQAVADSF